LGERVIELDQKVASVFAGKVVRKDLVRKGKVGANVPVFVLEYLLGKYCATDDPQAIEAGLRVVNTTFAESFVRPDEANKAQSHVKEKGSHTLIDKVKVRSLSEDDKYWAELVSFGYRFVHIPDHHVREYDRLLMGGVWAPVKIRHQYDDSTGGKKSPFWIDELKPIQVATFSLDHCREGRRQSDTTRSAGGLMSGAASKAVAQTARLSPCGPARGGFTKSSTRPISPLGCSAREARNESRLKV
jgi:ATP-dependent Lon protease